MPTFSSTLSFSSEPKFKSAIRFVSSPVIVQDLISLSAFAAKYMGDDVSVSGYEAVYGFNDSNKVAPWAVEPANWACSNGIVSGRGDNMLFPEATATRAEVSQIFAQYLKTK